MNDITEQIERFDRLAEALEDTEFAHRADREATDLMHTQTFTSMLSEDLRIEAAAEIGPDGRVESVTAYRAVGFRCVDPTQVDPGSGLWRAMEIWWERFRSRWSED